MRGCHVNGPGVTRARGRVLTYALAVLLYSVAVPGAHAAPILTTIGLPAPAGPEPVSLAFSPDWPLLATANNGGNSVSVFSVSAGAVLTSVGPPTATGSGPRAVAFSRQQGLLATANTNYGTVSLFEVSEHGALRPRGSEVDTPESPVAVAFTPDGGRLATANYRGDSVQMYTVEPGGLKAAGTHIRTDDGPAWLAFSPDGKMLATVSEGPNSGGTVSLFSVGPQGLVPRGSAPTRPGVQSFPTSVAFSPDGELIATTTPGPMGTDGWVSVFRVSEDGGPTPVAPPTPTGRHPRSLAFSPSGSLLATADRDGDTVTVFAVSPTGGLSQVSRTPTADLPHAVAFSADGRLLATADAGLVDGVSMFSVSSGGLLTPVGSPTATGAQPAALTFSRDGGLLATADNLDDTLSVFAVGADGMLSRIGAPATGNGPAGVAFSPSGRWIATANELSATVSMFSVSPSRVVTALGATSTGTLGVSGPQAVAFSPDSRLLAVPNYFDDTLSMFVVSESGGLTLAGSVTPTGRRPGSVAFSPDAPLLATANTVGDSVSVFTVTPGGIATAVGPPVATGDGPRSVAFAPGRRLLATANFFAKSVSVFRVSDEGALTSAGPATATGDRPHAVAFSSDGKLLAVVNDLDDTLSTFLVADDGTLTPVGAPSPTGRAPVAVAFNAARQLVASANHADDSVSVFSLAAPALETRILSGPPPVVGKTPATFTFEANYPSTFECRLNDEEFEPCTTPKSYAGLPQDGYTFHVRARDLARKVATPPLPPPPSRSWVVDRTPPIPVSLLAPPAGAPNLRDPPTFSWSPTTDALSGIDRYELWIDETLRMTVTPMLCAAVCTVTLPAPLGHGRHSWKVLAFDGVDNDSASASRDFTVDAAPPTAFDLVDVYDYGATSDRRPLASWRPAVDHGIGLAGYDVLLDGEVVARVGPSRTTYAHDADLGEGRHTWQVVARDANGNERASAIQTVDVDLTPPVAALTASPDPALVGHTVVFDASGSGDLGGPIVDYTWDLDGDGTFERGTGATGRTSRSYDEVGIYGVQVRVTDRVGFSAVARIAQDVQRNDPPPPFGVSINDEAQYTRDPKVTLRVTWPNFATRMLVSNDGGFKRAKSLPLKRDTPWALDSSGPERLPKHVYVRFVNGLTISETYQDDIILDETAPRVTSALVRPAKEGAALVLRLRATDGRGSGVESVQVTNDRGAPKAQFRPRANAVKLTRRSGERRLDLRLTVYVRVRDRAGNLSRWRVAKRSHRAPR